MISGEKNVVPVGVTGACPVGGLARLEIAAVRLVLDEATRPVSHTPGRGRGSAR